MCFQLNEYTMTPGQYVFVEIAGQYITNAEISFDFPFDYFHNQDDCVIRDILANCPYPLKMYINQFVETSALYMV